jgi:hypothetical protein
MASDSSNPAIVSIGPLIAGLCQVFLMSSLGSWSFPRSSNAS